jgi:hypothetical protein
VTGYRVLAIVITAVATLALYFSDHAQRSWTSRLAPIAEVELASDQLPVRSYAAAR